MKNAIVLGGTAPHIKLIEELHERGFFVILIDFLDNPPAKEFADLHIKENALDKEAVLRIAKEQNAEIVISACVDQANSVCCFVAEKMGLPHPYSYLTSLEVTNKIMMKTKMLSGGIHTIWFYHGKSLLDINWDLISFPAVVKPADCNSSKGVKKVNSIEDAKKCFEKALEISRTGEALVEGFVEGTEIQVDCYADENNTDIVLCRQKKQISRELNLELNSTGSIFPSAKCLEIKDDIRETASKISKIFKLTDTPFFFQGIIDSNNNLFVIEFAPRIGGGLSYYILKEIVGFDPIVSVLDSYYRNRYFYSLKPINGFYSTNLIYMEEGVFGKITGLKTLKEKSVIEDFFITKKAGSLVDSDLKSGNRVGAFIVRADSIKRLKEVEDKVYSLIDVLDVNGASKIRRLEIKDETPFIQ